MIHLAHQGAHRLRVQVNVATRRPWRAAAGDFRPARATQYEPSRHPASGHCANCAFRPRDLQKNMVPNLAKTKSKLSGGSAISASPSMKKHVPPCCRRLPCGRGRERRHSNRHRLILLLTPSNRQASSPYRQSRSRNRKPCRFHAPAEKGRSPRCAVSELRPKCV